jgi:hypothetical protein
MFDCQPDPRDLSISISPGATTSVPDSFGIATAADGLTRRLARWIRPSSTRAGG